MTLLQQTSLPLRRHDVDLAKHKHGYDEGLVNDAANALFKTGDLKLVERAMIARFARVLVQERDEDKGTVVDVLRPVNTRVDNAVKAAIISGQYEFIRLQLYNNIVGATATLFSETGSRYEYSDPDIGDELAALRLQSAVSLEALRWDSLAVGVGSALLNLSTRGGKLVERMVSPNAVHVAFAGSISDGDSERVVDELNIDEASVVTMCLEAAAEKSRFAAWFGPSVTYPLGRHVLYTASKFSDIPDPGTEGAMDYTVPEGQYRKEGDVESLANPLSAWAAAQGRHDLPVYPFVVLYGSPLGSGLLPISTSLYEVGLEFDLAASLIFGAAGRGARGAQKLTRKDNADQAIPANVSEGLIVLGRNVDLNQVGWSPTHAKAAMEVVADFAKKIAESNHVPGYLAVSNDSAAPPSGIAIARLSEPMTRYRKTRIGLNRASVVRRFELEKTLINAARGETVVPEDMTEAWNPGEREFVLDPTEKAAEWKARVDLGEAAMVDVVRDMRGLDSEEAAWAWMEERKKSLDEHAELVTAFKGPAKATAKTNGGGLFGGGR